MIRIEPFDPATSDEATALAWAEVNVAFGDHWAPAGLPPTAEWLLTEARHPSATERKRWWVAYEDGAVAGTAELEWHEAEDNRDRAFLIIELMPGHGTDEVVGALVRAAAAAAEPHGRTLLNLYAPEGWPATAWFGARGGTCGSVEEVNIVRFDRVSRADVEALAAATPDGYELLRFDGPVPDDLLEPFLRLADTMNDAPRDDLTMEDWTFTPERVRAYEAALAARGHEMWTLVAREVATGELAAFNQLLVYPEWPEVIENEDTAVARPHRGRGLGLWIKSVNLLRAMDHPGARCVLTWNAASNSHMLRVNRRLGFECEHVWESWELPTSAALAE